MLPPPPAPGINFFMVLSVSVATRLGLVTNSFPPGIFCNAPGFVPSNRVVPPLRKSKVTWFCSFCPIKILIPVCLVLFCWFTWLLDLKKAFILSLVSLKNCAKLFLSTPSGLWGNSQVGKAPPALPVTLKANCALFPVTTNCLLL